MLHLMGILICADDFALLNNLGENNLLFVTLDLFKLLMNFFVRNYLMELRFWSYKIKTFSRSTFKSRQILTCCGSVLWFCTMHSINVTCYIGENKFRKLEIFTRKRAVALHKKQISWKVTGLNSTSRIHVLCVKYFKNNYILKTGHTVLPTLFMVGTCLKPQIEWRF